MLRSLSTSIAAAALVFVHASGCAADAAAKLSVDVQFSLCAAPLEAQRGLALRPRGSPFDVWLFDNPALALFEQGLRIRLRGTAGGTELTLKVANQDCANLPSGRLPAEDGKCEYDMHDGKVAGALSLTRTLDSPAAAQLVAGSLPLASALNPAQTRFLRDLPGAWPLPAGVRALGPARVHSYRTKGKPYVVDISELPGGQRFIEISRKGPLADAERIRDRLHADLAQAGVPACADQSAQAVNKLRALLGSP